MQLLVVERDEKNIGFQILIGFLLGLIGAILGVGDTLSSIYALATFIPTIAVMVRRLHDINFSGWWALLSFIPLVNIIGLLKRH